MKVETDAAAFPKHSESVTAAIPGEEAMPVTLSVIHGEEAEPSAATAPTAAITEDREVILKPTSDKPTETDGSSQVTGQTQVT